MYCRAVAASVIDYFIDLFWIFWISRVFISLLSSPFFICQLWWHELLWILYCSWPNVQWLYLCLPIEEYTSPTKIKKPEKYIFQLYSWEFVFPLCIVNVALFCIYFCICFCMCQNWIIITKWFGMKGFSLLCHCSEHQCFPWLSHCIPYWRWMEKKGKLKTITLKKIFTFFSPV